MDKTINSYINQLHLDPKKEKAVRQIVELAGGSGGGMTEVTYAELRELRDNGKLIPGAKYRMIDYETTTSQEGTQAAGHPFDLILTALDEKTLDEKCSAIWSERDVDGYFANSNLPAWEVRYCLDNNINRFEWAEFSGISINVDVSDFNMGIVTVFYDGTVIYNGKEYCKWRLYGPSYILTINKEPNIGDTTIYVVIQDGEIVYVGETGVVSSTIINLKGGKGVIYRMIDEYNNDLPYDFKNIMFTRKISDGVLDAEGGTDTFVYTFNYYEDSVCKDYTNNSSVCTGNYMTYSTSLPNNVFLISNFSPGDDCVNNIFGGNCYDNTFGKRCRNNIFGYNCYSNTFGNNCSNNTFGNNCKNNIFGNSFTSNTFGDDTYYNTFGDNCTTNIFNNFCTDNIFGNEFSRNIVRNSYSNNTIGDNCYNSTFEKNCYNNTVGDYCGSIIFGVNCHYNTIGNHCSNITFGDDCNNNNFNVHYSMNIELKNNIQSVKFSTSDSGSTMDYARNYEIKNVSGYSDSIREITLTRSNTFTTYISKSSNGDIIQYTDEDIYNAIQAAKTES